jgi:hypothetical protein
MRALESSAALERMTADQREALRDAADTLVLAQVHDNAARTALTTARAVLLSARTSDRDQWIEQRDADLEDTGPASSIASSPTAAGRRGALRGSRPDQPARR